MFSLWHDNISALKLAAESLSQLQQANSFATLVSIFCLFDDV